MSFQLLESLRIKSDVARKKGKKKEYEKLRVQIDKMIHSLQTQKKIKPINIEKYLNQKEEGYHD